jgi:hypothetical protein
MRPWLSLQTRRAPWLRVGGSTTVDARYVGAGERTPPDVALRRRADAVRTTAPRRFLHRDHAALHRDAADVPALAGEPAVAVGVERGRVQVRVRRARGQRIDAHCALGPAHTHHRVLSAVGEPCRLVRALDHAVRRRAAAERDQFAAAALGVEPAEVAAALRRVPDAAVGRRRDVVDAGALRRAQRPGLQPCRGLGARRAAPGGTGGENKELAALQVTHGRLLRRPSYDLCRVNATCCGTAPGAPSSIRSAANRCTAPSASTRRC